MNESREALWDRIAADAAGGEKVTALAHKYGYTQGGMHSLLASDKMQFRIEAVRSQIDNAQRLMRTKMALAAPDLVDAEIETALGRRQVFDENGNPATDRNGAPVFEWENPPALRMQARHYIMDKLYPTTVHTMNETHAVVDQRVAVEIRDSLVALRTTAPPPVDIRRSRFVLEGHAAIPSALEVPGGQK